MRKKIEPRGTSFSRNASTIGAQKPKSMNMSAYSSDTPSAYQNWASNSTSEKLSTPIHRLSPSTL